MTLPTFSGLLLFVFLTSTVHVQSSTDVSNLEIKDAILNLVNVFNNHAGKLERHEFRERQLGDQIKKALVTLDKRHRAEEQKTENMEIVLSKIDERLRSVESMIIQRDERERIQLQKMTDAVERVTAQSSEWARRLESTFGTGGATAEQMGSLRELVERIESNLPASSSGMPAEAQATLDIMERRLERVEKSIMALLESAGDSKNSEAEKLRAASANLVSTESKWRQHLTDAESVLNRFGEGLDNLAVEIQRLTSGNLTTGGSGESLGDAILDSLEGNQQRVDDVAQLTQSILQEVNSLRVAGEMEQQKLNTIANTTEEGLRLLAQDLLNSSEKATLRVDSRLKEIRGEITRSTKEIHTAVSESDARSELLIADARKSYERLQEDMQALPNVEKVLLHTADSVLDTRRRIEYGVQQILLEVGDMVKLQSVDLNNTVRFLFGNISSTILLNQTEALTNLSSSMETEISQVWRQIGIMYHQLIQSVGMLDKIQVQTENYVNGSLKTMDSMEGKVGQITDRMGEVDDNLNYLVGRLSLVTQEFNLIKSGLGTALDNIRNSFAAIQENIPTAEDTNPKKDIPEQELPYLNEDENEDSIIDVEAA